MSQLAKTWRVRGTLGVVEIELHPDSVDTETRVASLRELRNLFLAAQRGDTAARRAILEIYTELRGTGARAVTPTDLDLGSPRSDVVEELQSAVRRGGLVVRPPQARSLTVPPAADSGPELGPQAPDSGPTWFSLKVLDEVGDPVDGIDIAYSLGGTRRVVTTDGGGVARLTGVEGSSASVVPASLQAVRDKLKPRWEKPRDEAIAKGDNVFVHELDALGESISIASETLNTLVIKPFFRCYEVPGAHFSFGRSFVLRAGIQTLAELAEVVEATDLNGNLLDRHVLVVGHTDQSGGPELNKELSERRAKAVQALFTHDFAAWEDLFSNRVPGKYWNEVWDVFEAQHMLNTLGVTDKKGKPLTENGVRDLPTQQAINSFRVGDDYPDRPAEQKTLSPGIKLGPDGRKELFLAYAKRVTRKPVAQDRFVVVDGQPFLGCGVFNPLSMAAQDAESRRVVVFVFDSVKTPTGLPCKKGSVAPCPKASAPPLEPSPAPPYRCPYYQKIAGGCPCQGGADLTHDLIVRLVLPLDRADDSKQVFVLENDDGARNAGQHTLVIKQTLASDARATDGGLSELHFTHVPESHSWRIRSEGSPTPYTIMDATKYEQIHERSPLAVTPLFPGVAANLDPILDEPP